MNSRVHGILRRFPNTRGANPRAAAPSRSPRATLLAFLLVLICTGPSLAQPPQDPPEPVPDERSDDALFSLDSPIGLIEYNLGRGLHFGWTGLNIGGFATFEIEKERGENGVFAIDGLNFLVLFEPIQPVRLFMELEVGNLFEVDMHTGITESSPTVNFQRLFGEFSVNDAFNVRVGKYQTPVGRWNLVPAEPFVWTSTEPFLLQAFDEHTTGPMLLGNLFPAQGVLSYWVYGQMAAFDPEEDEEPVDQSVGGRLEYSSDRETWSIGSSLLASQVGNRWGYLAGLDGEFNYGPLELTSEFVYNWGPLEHPFRWDIYLQGVLETLPKLYLVGRYEYSAGIGSDPNLHIGDVGLAWRPVSFLNFKATYRFTNKRSEEVPEGFKASFSVLF